MRAYLAGPDVFLPTASEVGADKVALCRAYGFDGHFPLDGSLRPDEPTLYDQGLAIYRANLQIMAACDLAFVNLTPFRGPSADAGTVFELGWLVSAGKPVFAYSSDTRPYTARVTPDAYAIERHQMHDNLMLDAAVAEQGWHIVAVPEPDAAEPLAARAAFEQAVQLAATRFSRSGSL
ncbi:nucleoside 2-deoxyribosyltransferase [Algihabitans albus]|uniref:nucleoside 2-deoxyribosyltransferase n=1 Tax=Algihabitans albus TaxID=2164067 RepID=UPI000E5D7841|nr:nucleoside 2-deoxyribosyltransferase [Algihabitans albus]